MAIDRRVYACAARNGTLILSGFVADYDQHDVMGGPDFGGWRETIPRNAWGDALARAGDLWLRINFQGGRVARTGWHAAGGVGGLHIMTLDQGVHVVAVLPQDRFKLDHLEGAEWRYSFKAESQTWQEPSRSERFMHTMRLHEIGILTAPAEPAAVVADRCLHTAGAPQTVAHACHCKREKLHPVSGVRFPHVCHCGAAWADRCDPDIGYHTLPHQGCVLR